MTSSKPPSSTPPPDAWDSHVHIFDEDRFPMHPHHAFHPKKASLDSLREFHRDLGISNACLVAFSPYYTDNSSVLDALGTPGGPKRAVACVDPKEVTEEELKTLHRAGVRGVRVNLRTRSEVFDADLVRDTAARIRLFGWVMQIYLSLDQIVDLAPLVQDLRVPIVIDHIGSPHDNGNPAKSQKGYAEFMNLLRRGLIWTKLSGVYRFPDLPDLDEYVVEILRVAPDRVVWASDWPHSGGAQANPDGDRDKIQEYRKIDDRAWVERCWQWCRDVGGGDGRKLAEKIWVTNPRRLWQVD